MLVLTATACRISCWAACMFARAAQSLEGFLLQHIAVGTEDEMDVALLQR